MIVLIYFLLVLIFILLQAIFTCSEIAFISSNVFKLHHRIEKGDRGAKLAFKLISNPEKFLATILVGINLSVIVSSSLATLILIHLKVPNANFWITFLYVPFIVIFAELFPKNLGRLYKEKIICKLSFIIKLFEDILDPIVSVIERTTRIIIRIVTGKYNKRRSPFITKEEIKSMVREIQKYGILDRGEKKAIEDIFDLRQRKIKDVVTPLKKVVTLDYNDTYDAILQKIKEAGYTRYPVWKDKMIVGYINIFDLFYKKDDDWHKFIRPIIHIGKNQKLYEVFTTLKSNKENAALVIKGRKVLGLITLDDLVREIIISIVS
ncbi:MAG: CNNM domain-containing protein [Candidatus Omnitrophica bacterium]|nr:CNNM domain-containing protein [Candidatus Omnitrophota bacterium]